MLHSANYAACGEDQQLMNDWLEAKVPMHCCTACRDSDVCAVGSRGCAAGLHRAHQLHHDFIMA